MVNKNGRESDLRGKEWRPKKMLLKQAKLVAAASTTSEQRTE
jgi:hypothetical protein